MADLALDGLFHASAFGGRAIFILVLKVVLEAGEVDVCDGASAVAGGHEGVGIGVIETNSALFCLAGPEASLCHNKSQLYLHTPLLIQFLFFVSSFSDFIEKEMKGSQGAKDSTLYKCFT